MCEIIDVIILLLLLVAAVLDWKQREIPILLLVIFSVIVALFAVCCADNIFWPEIGGAFLGALFFVISKCTNQAVGYGDSWIILLLGIYLGGFQVLQLLFVASAVSGICSLIYLWKRRWKRDITLPFVPFMAMAYIGVVLV